MIIYIKQLLTASFWGATFIAGRILSEAMSPYTASFLRFLIASLILLTLIRFQEGKLPGINKKQFLGILSLGLTGVFCYNIFFFAGLKTIPAGRAALIIALNPVLISLISSLFLGESFSRLKGLGITCSVMGAITVISSGKPWLLFSGHLEQGDYFIMGCVVSWVSYSIIGKKVLKGLSPLVTVGYSATAGTTFLFIPALLTGLPQEITSYSTESWTALFYLSFFGTVLAFIWYYQGIKRIGAMKTSVFINFVPVSAILLAALILDEPITSTLILGATMVISGVFMTNFSQFKSIKSAEKKSI